MATNTKRTYVKTHEDFFKVLSESMALTRKYMEQEPSATVYGDVEIQLDQMIRWTADGGQPTAEERDRIYVGTIAFYQLRSRTDPEKNAYANRLMELTAYFNLDWPADREP
jgi:hypothetical protein